MTTDHRTYREGKPNAPGAHVENPVNTRWWGEEGDKGAQVCFAVYRMIEKANAEKENLGWQNLRLYNGQTRDDYLGQFTGAGGSGGLIGALERRLFGTLRGYSLNVTGSVINTLVSRTGSSDVKVTFLTDGGAYKLQQRAKKLDKLIEGVLYAARMRITGPECLRDGCWNGQGWAMVYEDPDRPQRVCVERVFPMELVWESHLRDPRQMFRRKLIPKEVLRRRYAKKPEILAKLEKLKDAMAGDYSFRNVADYVVVVEAWHLPSKPGADDGVHRVVADSIELFNEPWDFDYFPFASIKFEPEPIGTGARGVCHLLTGIQVELNKLLRSQQEALRLMAVPHWYVPRSAKIQKSHINNDIGTIIEGDSPTPPQLLAVNPVPDQVVAQIENLYRKAYEIIGVSQFAAQAIKPAGLNSGVAQRAYADNQTERFAALGKAYEEFYCEIARRAVDLIRAIHKRDAGKGGFKANVPGAKFLNTIEWKDAGLDEDEYVLKVFPTNLLPKTPEGRLQAVQEMIEAGMVTQQQGLSLLDFPDLAAVNDLANAPLDNIMWQADRFLDDGPDSEIYRAPEKYQDLSLGVRLMTEQYLKAQRTGVEDEKLDRFRRWIEQAEDLMTPPPAPPGPVAPGGMPTGAAPNMAPAGVPAPPPQAELLPTHP